MKKLIFRELSEKDIRNIFHTSKGNVAEYFYNFETLEQARRWVMEAITKQLSGAKIEYVVYDDKDFIGMVSPQFLNETFA